MIRSRRPAAAALLGLAVLALGACSGKQAEEQTATAEPTAASSEWVAENPTEPAVPVDLPKTPMTSAPVAPAASPSPAAQ